MDTSVVARRPVPLSCAVVLFAVVLLAGCGGNRYALPDREDLEVLAKETRLAEMIGASRGGASCDVRLLDSSGKASFVWADCLGWNGATSGPMRVEDGSVTAPGDGSLYSDDIHTMFPEGLAQLILEHPDELRP